MSQDLVRFSRAVLALNGCTKPEELETALLAAMRALFDADSHVVNWLGLQKFEDISTRSADLPREALLSVFNEHLDEHPLLHLVQGVWKTDPVIAGRWSDTISFREFRQKALYHDFFRHTGTRYQMATTLRIDHKSALGLSVNRARLDFEPEEVMLLEQLGLHIRQVVESLVSRMDLERALAFHQMAAELEASVVVDAHAGLLYATERAKRLMREYFPGTPTGGLPLELRSWMRANPEGGRTTTRELPGRRLTCSIGPAIPWPDNERQACLLSRVRESAAVRVLRLSEQRDQVATDALAEAGLTPREIEVLQWMSRGKRNGEIAVILGLSERTVDKHREHLFAKLGVETRTAAVAAMHELS